MRVWLPDRPGALGAVASRIGSVKGDVIGIEILERGAGRAVDDLVVALPDPSLVDLLVAEVGEVDGVDIEDIIPLASEQHDPDLDTLEAAGELLATGDTVLLAAELCRQVADAHAAAWSAVVDLVHREVVAAAGAVPSIDWLVAFAWGSRSSESVHAGHSGADDAVSAPVGDWAALVVGRDGHPFRARERRRLNALARIVEQRLAELQH
jgi:hypothetical protein